jgi:hypothetical protein
MRSLAQTKSCGLASESFTATEEKKAGKTHIPLQYNTLTHGLTIERTAGV